MMDELLGHTVDDLMVYHPGSTGIIYPFQLIVSSSHCEQLHRGVQGSYKSSAAVTLPPMGLIRGQLYFWQLFLFKIFFFLNCDDL